MPTYRYLNFDLQFERTETGYRLHARGPDGLHTAAFTVPVSATELENLVLRIGRTRRTMRRIDPPEIEAAKQFGHRLYQAVFSPQISATFRKSIELAEQQQAGLRVRVRLTHTPELANLPWEYLYDQQRNRFLALSVETPLVRYLDIPERIRPLTVELPLRALAIIANPRGQANLDVEHEWTNIQSALHDLTQRGALVLDRLEQPTLAALQRRLRQTPYHVIHFIGHGDFVEHMQDGILLLEDTNGDEYRVTGQELGMLLHDHRSLRLAVLNVCEGGRSATNDPFAGVAQSLVQQGIPAVIAMQFEVSDEAAIAIAHEFYSAITDGYPVDAALSEARKSVFAQGYRLEWGTPVLYLRAPDGQIFSTDAVNQPAQPLPTLQRTSVEPQSPVIMKQAEEAVTGQPSLTVIQETATPAEESPTTVVAAQVPTTAKLDEEADAKAQPPPARPILEELLEQSASIFGIAAAPESARPTEASAPIAQALESSATSPAHTDAPVSKRIPARSSDMPFELTNTQKRYLAIAGLLIAGLLLNIGVGEVIFEWHALPLLLDSIGTILVGALLGPWAGAGFGTLGYLLWSGSGTEASTYTGWYIHIPAVIGLLAGFAARARVFSRNAPRWLAAVVGAIGFFGLTYCLLTLLGGPYDKSGFWLVFPVLGDKLAEQPLLFVVTIAVGAVVGYFWLARIGYVGMAGVLVGLITAVLSAPVVVYRVSGSSAFDAHFFATLQSDYGFWLGKILTANEAVSDPLDKMFCFLIAWLLLQAIPPSLRKLFPNMQANTEDSPVKPGRRT